MAKIIGTILDRNYNKAHENHIHVEPPIKKYGVPPTKNPGMTPGIEVIYNALIKEFGPGAYFVDPPEGTKWTHMGGWNRRPIDGSSSWSQHAWWNALDIGPYYGTDQDKFVEFLKNYDTERKDEDLAILTESEQKELQRLLGSIAEVDSNPYFPEFVIPGFRALGPALRAIDKRLDSLEAGGVGGGGASAAELQALKAEVARIRDALLKAGGA